MKSLTEPATTHPRWSLYVVSRRAPWERLLFVLFVWMAVEDQTRKAFDNELWVSLIKDAVVAAILFDCLSRNISAGHRMPRWLGATLIWGLVLYLLGAVNPKLSSPLIPLIGLKLTFFYVPLFLVGQRLAADTGRLKPIFETILAVAAGIAGIGIYQALVDPLFLTPEQAGNLEGAQLWLTRGEGIRYVTSTFLSPGRYVLFLLNGLGVAVTLLLWDDQRRRLRFLALTIILAGALTSGARAGVTSVIATATLAALLGRSRAWRSPSQRHLWTKRYLLTSALGLLIVMASAVAFSPQATSIASFYWNSLVVDESNAIGPRVVAYLEQFSPDVIGVDTWIFGNGSGSASYGVNQLVSVPESVTEGGYIWAVWELGALGLLFYLALAFQLSTLFLRPPAGAPSQARRALVIGLGPVVLWELWGLNLLGPILQQYAVAIFLWFFCGLAYGMKTAEEESLGRG